MRLILALLATLPLLGQTHQGVDYVGYNLKNNSLVIKSETHSATEEVLLTREFIVNFNNRKMATPFEVREFTEREAKTISNVMGVIVKVFRDALQEPYISQIVWLPYEKKIVVNTDKPITIFIDGRVTSGNIEKLEDEYKREIFAYSNAILQYAIESIEWWDNDEGTKKVKI